jgi:hypothetical protein
LHPGSTQLEDWCRTQWCTTVVPEGRLTRKMMKASRETTMPLGGGQVFPVEIEDAEDVPDEMPKLSEWTSMFLRR